MYVVVALNMYVCNDTKLCTQVAVYSKTRTKVILNRKKNSTKKLLNVFNFTRSLK